MPLWCLPSCLMPNLVSIGIIPFGYSPVRSAYGCKSNNKIVALQLLWNSNAKRQKLNNAALRLNQQTKPVTFLILIHRLKYSGTAYPLKAHSEVNLKKNTFAKKQMWLKNYNVFKKPYTCAYIVLRSQSPIVTKTDRTLGSNRPSFFIHASNSCIVQSVILAAPIHLMWAV